MSKIKRRSNNVITVFRGAEPTGGITANSGREQEDAPVGLNVRYQRVSEESR
jgi:hypothetical protein